MPDPHDILLARTAIKLHSDDKQDEGKAGAMEESIVNAAFVHFSEAKAALIDLQSLRVYTITLLVRVSVLCVCFYSLDRQCVVEEG